MPTDDPDAAETATLRTVLGALLAAVGPDVAGERADRLVAAFGSLAAIGRASRVRLAALVGGEAADLLLAYRAAMLWALREPAIVGPIVATRADLLEYLHHCTAAAPDESLRALFLNARRELIAEELIARGGPDGVAVEPRTVIVRALESGATGVVLVHNHPSGDPEPSAADRRFTRAVAAAGDVLGIRLHDHLVVARGGHRRVGGDPSAP